MDKFDIHEWKWKQLLNEAEFDAKKADLNKDGKISDYEEKRGKAIAKNMDEAVPFKKNALDEHDWMNDPKDESGMVHVQLKSIIQNASKLLQQNPDGEQYDAWVQAKITKAADYLQSVHDYQSYEK